MWFVLQITYPSQGLSSHPPPDLWGFPAVRFPQNSSMLNHPLFRVFLILWFFSSHSNSIHNNIPGFQNQGNPPKRYANRRGNWPKNKSFMWKNSRSAIVWNQSNAVNVSFSKRGKEKEVSQKWGISFLKMNYVPVKYCLWHEQYKHSNREIERKRKPVF